MDGNRHSRDAKELPPFAGELVLGIDAAWTAHHPSGVALGKKLGQAWRCLAVAPSYVPLLTLTAGGSIIWTPIPQASIKVLAA